MGKTNTNRRNNKKTVVSGLMMRVKDHVENTYSPTSWWNAEPRYRTWRSALPGELAALPVHWGSAKKMYGYERLGIQTLQVANARSDQEVECSTYAIQTTKTSEGAP